MIVESYTHRNSPIHKISAVTKIWVIALMSIVIYVVNSPVVLGIFLIIIGALFYIARLSISKLLTELKYILSSVFLISIIHFIFNNWLIGIVIGLRFLDLMLLASLITLTTKLSDLIDALERGLKPLAYVGINTDKISMMLSITIRFIPVLTQQLKSIQEAQTARGLNNNIIAILIPLFVKTLRTADDLTDALHARCYDID